MSEARKEIVIIGSGYAGVETYKQLDKKKLNNVNITLISKTNYFYHNVASPRAIVDTKIAEDICLKLDRIIKGNDRQFILGSVLSIDENASTVTFNKIESNQNDSIKFDYLVLALGSAYASPFHSSEYDRSKQIDLIKDYNDKIKSANKILIVGGGAVGVELAGELKTDFPNKNVTIVTNGNRLVPSMSESFSTKALNILNQKHVETIFNDKINLTNVENFQTTKIKTENGKEIEFDAYFVCFGVFKPNTDWLKNCMASSLDSRGFIKIKDTFQFEANANMFAMGDCCNLNEPKLAYKAAGHAETVAFNIEQLIKNNQNKLKKYVVSDKPMMLLSIGRNQGVFQMGSMTFKGCLPTMFKSKGLFISKYKSELGY
jgi:apoptosis-inducing factor 2